MKIKNNLITTIILTLALFQSCYGTDSSRKTITILHTNDIHAGFVPVSIKSKEPQGGTRWVGGVQALNHYISKFRAEQPQLLLLDAGDFMTGNPISDIEVDSARGGALIHFFNYMKYYGMTLGNHEFDISVANVRNLIRLCNFPVVSANLFTEDGALFTEKPYVIFTKADLKIGVIGVIVDDLKDYINMPQRNQVIVRPAIPIVDSLAQVIDPLTDLIIVLSHRGLDADYEMASNVGPAVDIIIGGHSHSRLKEPVRVNGKYIVQAGSNCMNLGHIDVTVAADTVQQFTYELIPLENEGVAPDSSLQKEIAIYENQINAEYDRVIGELVAPWHRNSEGESNIGNFIADCIRTYCEADFAVINSGGIRRDLDSGVIKKLDIKNILPFNNSLCKFEMTGANLLNVIHNNALAAMDKQGGILQVSGLTIAIEKKGDGSIKILKAHVNGKKIDPQRIYTGATVDFVLANYEKYLYSKPEKVIDLMIPLTEVVVKAIEQQKKIDSKIEGRIRMK
ncbi:MAG: bifunctional metallophosphatase/5'-nucleotidase [Candidatus Zhuqueibacterota bacterium]